MDIKTERELAFFMAGIECGRMFNVAQMSTSKMGIWFESLDGDGGILATLVNGFLGFEGDTELWPNDLRHPALRGILADARRDAKTAFNLKREILREHEQKTEGGKQ